MLVSAQCQPRYTVCIDTLPLTQAAVALTPSPRHSLSTRYLEAERPVSTLCGAGAPLHTSQCSDGSQAAVSLSAVWCKARVRTQQLVRAAECVGAGTSQPVTHPGLGWAGLGWAGLGWDPATDVNWGPNMGMPPGHPGPGHAATTRAHVSPKQLSYFHVNHKILPNEMDDSTFS